jgi:hypothetical protein
MEKVIDLKDVAVISGKPGLFKILKPAKNGVIVEAIDNPKLKIITNNGHKVSILKEISVYTVTGEGAVPLEEVFFSIRSHYSSQIPVSKDAPEAELRAFMDKILPDNDSARIYLSDIKKLISWYNMLDKFLPEVLERKEPAQEEISAVEANAEPEKEEKEKKKAAPKKKKNETDGVAKSEKAEAKTEKTPKKAKKTETVEAEKAEEAPKKTRSKKAKFE